MLFPESQEATVQRLDEQILSLILGYGGGPLGLKLDETEKTVLRSIRTRHGVQNAITIAEIQQHGNLTARAIKDAVRTLRMAFCLPIGSTKNVGSGGYFLMVSPDDRSIWAKDVTDQVRAELSVLRHAAGKQICLEMLGQLQMEISGAGTKLWGDPGKNPTTWVVKNLVGGRQKAGKK